VASKLNLSLSLSVPRSHQDLEPFQLVLTEIELLYINDSYGLLHLLLFMIVSGRANVTLVKYLELFVCEFGLYLFERSLLVRVMNVDEVGFDVVWDCGVVWDFVEMRLTGSAVEHVTQLFCKGLHEICDYWLMEFVYFIFIINQSMILTF
jgi:hypothetical protein